MASAPPAAGFDDTPMDDEEDVPMDGVENVRETVKPGRATTYWSGSGAGGARDSVPLIDTAEPEEHEFEFDMVVIGGGSGGLACAKACAAEGKKVACLDFVKPSPQGTSWGLGGTCVNVGCIPKKLMHQAGLIGDVMEDAQHYGWKAPERELDWGTLVQNVTKYIRSLNFGYRTELTSKSVKYINALGKFTGPHTLEAKRKNGQVDTITSRRFVISVGGRPVYPDIPGAQEFGITSDDIFKLDRDPGKTLVVGGSYVALECAGFLTAIGRHATVAIRSIPLRGFDEDMAERIVAYMSKQGTEILRKLIPTKIEEAEAGSPHRYKVTLASTTQGSSETMVTYYDTVLFATGRRADTAGLGLEAVGVKVQGDSGKLVVDACDRTNIPYVYAIGDVVKDGLELTPVAIKAGKLLAARLYAAGTKCINYEDVPTTVFTPLEYGCVGLSESAAIEKYSEDNIEVFHVQFLPLEWQLPKKGEDCYTKLICVKNENLRVCGFHICSPNAGEITQAVAIAIRMGATKDDISDTIGIHPTIAEEITTLQITKSSGVEASKAGGC